MPIVVTGAAGFIGRATVAELRRRGADVVALDRRPVPTDHSTGPATVGAHDNPGAALTGTCLTLSGDLLDRDELADAAFASASAVVHLAGCPGVRDSSEDVAVRRARDNVAATERVLRATPAGVPVIVASSSSVYGGSDGRPCLETDRLAPRGGYARSKAVVEQLCAARARSGGLVTVVRPFTVVGEGQRADMAIALWLAAARAGQPLPVFGSLDRRRDFTDVRQVARVLATLCEPGRAPGGVLNVGSGRPQPLSDLVAAVAEVIAAPLRVQVTPAAAVEPAETWADTRRLEQAVGFVPRTSLVDVVRRAASPQPASLGARALVAS